MKKYTVYFSMRNLHCFDVVADTPEEAKKLASLRIEHNDEGDEIDHIDEEPQLLEVEEINDDDAKFRDADGNDYELCIPSEHEAASRMIRFRVAEEIKKKFKKHCVDENVSMAMVLEKLLLTYMDNKELIGK